MRGARRQDNSANRSKADSAETEEAVLLTVKQAARKTQVGERKLRDMIKAKELPAKPYQDAGSTDVGDVSWYVPTSGLTTACFAAGSPGHSWQNVAAVGSPIGHKGMMVAAKTLDRNASPTEAEARYWLAAISAVNRLRENHLCRSRCRRGSGA